MIKKFLKYVAASAYLWLPTLVFAQGGWTITPVDEPDLANPDKNLASLIDLILYYINLLLVLLMGIAILIFIWYVVQYFIRPDTNKAEGGKHIMYSLIGFFVILSFWGIINIIQNTFGLNNETYRPPNWESFEELFPAGRNRHDGSGRPGGYNIHTSTFS
jgi:hypothetical protein